MRDTFKRKNIRLNPAHYRGERGYFLTLCFQGRCRYGSEREFAEWLLDHLREFSVRQSFEIHAYCLMPDHLHLLAVGTSRESDLLAFVNSFKQETGFVFQKKRGKRLWQFKFYDHILRRPQAMDSVAWYIWLNPVRKGLCERPNHYPYSGSFTEEGRKVFCSLPRNDWNPPWKRKKGPV